MITLPRLRTGATAQYPATITNQYSNRVLEFLDGSLQTYPASFIPKKAIQLNYQNLTPSEAKLLQQLAVEAEGQLNPISFEDPWTAEVRNDYHLSDSLVLTLRGEQSIDASLLLSED